VDAETGKQPLALAALIAEQRISIWYSTPSTLRLLSRYGRLSKADFSQLKLVLFAGEVFPKPAFTQLREQWPSPRYFNLYGPTETNVCTWFEVTQDIEKLATFPIGQVCDNDRARVMDGELLVRGGTVMAGYWNRPDLDLAAFWVDDNGGKWYRTGDIVRETGDGYVFVGRRDRMVKRRGFRIELGEVEAALMTHPLIHDAAVTAVSDDESGVRLDAALVTPGITMSVIELRKFCADALPLYMIPDRFRFLDSIPQTSTGKVDYLQLQETET
jgi:acyl-coenzyme A synthetase/AMP-(fatty) acid ligase